jgi:hypothetical protein
MSKRKSKQKHNTSRSKRSSSTRALVGLAILLLVLAAGAVIVIALSAQDRAPDQPGQQVITLESEIIANLTNLPQATPLSGEAASQWEALRATVIDCDDYRPERRHQMEQHIDWLLDPSDIPTDIIIALGTNPTGRLIFGMATYTSSEWRLGGRQPDSCLLPIGQLLNELLVAYGDEPFDIYDENDG